MVLLHFLTENKCYDKGIMYVNFKVIATQDDLSFTTEANKEKIRPIECLDKVRQAMVFIRHGEPIDDGQNVCIPGDFALPEGINVHELFHGGAVRHIQTAKAICPKKDDIEVNRLKWLNEYDLGHHSKKDFESKDIKIDDQVRNNLEAFKKGHPKAKVGNETLEQFFNRNKSGLVILIQYVERKLEKNSEYKVLLVTSCGNLGFIELLLTSGGTFSDWPEKAEAYQYLQSKCFLDGKT